MPFHHNNQRLAVIGVPCDLGANAHGPDDGPDSLRGNGLIPKLEEIGYRVDDLGDIYVPPCENYLTESPLEKHLDEIISFLKPLAKTVRNALQQGQTPVVLGGDHSLSIGSIHGVGEHFQNEEIGVIWIDAHPDMNTYKTTETGNLHGMSMSALLGLGNEQLRLNPHFAVKTENAVFIGLRDIDPAEARLCKENGVHAFTMRDIDERGMPSVVHEAIEIASQNTAAVHVSFDMDSLDPSAAPGVSTPVPGGLTFREARLALETIYDNANISSFDLVELNPNRDQGNQTARVAVQIAQTLCGKRLL